MRFLLLDGYIDEPTALGVPPYISPYVRYVAGAILSVGGHEVVYQTIDQLREREVWPEADVVVLISGNPVPGKYLGGVPITSAEIDVLFQRYKKIPILWGGPQSVEKKGGSVSVAVVHGDIEAYVGDMARGILPRDRKRTPEEWHEFAVAGASIVSQHPNFPDVMIEIETGRGCPRRFHCSFCLEGLFDVEFRPVESIAEEVSRLSGLGCCHFRLGKQADLLSFWPDFSCEREGFFRPVPHHIEALYRAVRESAPNLKTLHLDNVNPGTIARFPDESARILEAIVRHNTPGDVAAFGMETADPAVVARNHLKANPAQVREAIRLVNEIGGKRVNGLPALLPGVNLIHGLPGESRSTFRMNYDFLKSIMDGGLLLRRINIRQLKRTPGTMLERERYHADKKTEAAFRHYRERIRNEIDMPMLKKIFEAGVILRDVIVEGHRGEWSLARPLASYPITVNIPRFFPLRHHLDVFVIDHRERSLVGLPFPFRPSELTYHEIKNIPGMTKQAGRLMASGTIALEGFRDSPLYHVLRASVS